MYMKTVVALAALSIVPATAEVRPLFQMQVRCSDGLCVISQEQLGHLLETNRGLAARVESLEERGCAHVELIPPRNL